MRRRPDRHYKCAFCGAVGGPITPLRHRRGCPFKRFRQRPVQLLEPTVADMADSLFRSGGGAVVGSDGWIYNTED